MMRCGSACQLSSDRHYSTVQNKLQPHTTQTLRRLGYHTTCAKQHFVTQTVTRLSSIGNCCVFVCSAAVGPVERNLIRTKAHLNEIPIERIPVRTKIPSERTPIRTKFFVLLDRKMLSFWWDFLLTGRPQTGTCIVLCIAFQLLVDPQYVLTLTGLDYQVLVRAVDYYDTTYSLASSAVV